MVYAAMHIFALNRLISHLPMSSFAKWTHEHQFSFILGVLAVISTNPLYLWRVKSASAIFAICEIFIAPVYRAAVCVAVLVFLKRVKNGKQGGIVWEVVFGIAICANEVWRLLNGLLTQRKFAARLEVEGGGLQAVLWSGFALCVGWRVMDVVRNCNGMEWIKVMIYVGAAGAIVGAEGFEVMGGRGGGGGGFDRKIMEGVVRLVVENSFSLLMLHLHCPYQIERERKYEFWDEGSESTEREGNGGGRDSIGVGQNWMVIGSA
jgi:hypothetical protein